MRGTTGEAPTQGEVDLVELDRDHPGFRDAAYRARRNDIARTALAWRFGDAAPHVEYSEVEHGVWKTALENLSPLHARYACAEFKACWPALGFRPDRVPQFAEVNAVLERETGFGLAPVAGLVSPRVFLADLGREVFLATQYIRHHSAPLYTPEPDVIHELVGHAALLAHPEFARLNRRFGEAVAYADEPGLEALIRVYWYALEFGVVRAEGGLNVVGAGLLSSFGELGRFEKDADLRPFTIGEIARTPFDPTDYQRTLFVAESTRQLIDALDAWLDTFTRPPRSPPRGA